ncbi:hypothetical protein [Fusobacterium sp. SYSU M8D902]|uniref:hypothetical protein n=1 Tax=Fusobacterium sp. SYSU M8D902 TaxID=3159562 RepID=UPI0032E4D5F2
MMTEALEKLLQTSSLAKIDPQTQLSEWATNKITGGIASNINQIVQNTPLLRKLYSFVRIFKEIKISIAEEKNGVELSIFTFPVTASNIKFIGNDNTIEEVDTIAGKINYKKDIDFKVVGFSSFFPNTYYSFSNDYKYFGIDCVNKVDELKLKETPIKLVITGVGLVLKCYISKFEYNTTPEGDINYSIEFEEAKDPSIYETQSKNYVFKPEAFNLSK